MEIPLDFFLRLIQNMLIDFDLVTIAKKINKHFEREEDDYSDVLDGLNLQKIIKFYISSNKPFSKKLKRKIKKIKEEKEEEEKEEEEDHKELNKKRKRKKSEEHKKEEKPQKKVEDDIDFENMVFQPKPKSIPNDGKRFQRIDDSLKDNLPKNLKDNSYEYFMKKTGDKFGQVANEKLKVTRGKDFKKEKTKFKNKTAHGGFTISTTVRSIPLDDSD